MSVLLGVDVGKVKVGIAKSVLNIVQPLDVVERARYRAEKHILSLLLTENVKEIIVGLPLSSDGSENEQCQDVYAFVKRLKKRTDIPIIYQDEYISSSESDGNDAKAAAIILKRHLFNSW
jgi:putative Holliday junction resolvase